MESDYDPDKGAVAYEDCARWGARDGKQVCGSKRCWCSGVKPLCNYPGDFTPRKGYWLKRRKR